jgi:transposase-like protein
MIKVNLDKAKELHKDNLRSARAQEFKSLDVDYMRALEENNAEKINQIVEIKTQLRNITSAEEIISAASVDDLKSHWPTDILSMPSPYTEQQ